MFSFRLGTVFGIDIKIHATFLLFLLFFTMFDGLGTAIWISLVFGSILLHELGHSLVALAFGLRVGSITLTPIGGIAQLLDAPRRWSQELLIAVAGPMVNFVIAGILFPLAMQFPKGLLADVASNLAWANLMLGAFNLLPAFPMDGGRVLRAFLSRRWGKLRATLKAASLGKWIAIALGAVGLFTSHFMLCVLAFFVYTMGQQEARAAMAESQFAPPFDQPPGVIYLDRRHFRPW